MNRSTGGPAFPFEMITQRHAGLVTEWTNYHGMTLRDYFAAKAMQAIIAGAMPSGVLQEEGSKNTVAKAAYEMADAMLEARK